MSMRDDMKKEGYSKEEEYFYRKDRELLEKLREKAAAQKEKAESENKKKDYWMRCPKCGSTMKEEKYADLVDIDRCPNQNCRGVYFDGGELEMVLKAKPSLLNRIFGR